jgi:hypothetical protein
MNRAGEYFTKTVNFPVPFRYITKLINTQTWMEAESIRVEDGFMEPMVLFGIQFTLSLAAYALIALWYVGPRLAGLPREQALVPLLWVHAFRVVGGTILAPGAVGAGVPLGFRWMVGGGDLATAGLALLALAALHARFRGATAWVWLCIGVGMVDTLNAVVQSLCYNVFAYPLGVNWVIVSMYVPALLVSSLLIFIQLLAPRRSVRKDEKNPRGIHLEG